MSRERPEDDHEMNAAALLALQHVDSALDAVANRRSRLPELAAHREAVAALTAHRAALAAQRAIVAGAQQRIDANEVTAHGLDAKKARLEAQLKTVIAPREAEALMSEIRTIDAEHGELDDLELQAMEEQAEAERQIAALLAAEPALVEAVAGCEAALATAGAALDAEQLALDAERVVAAAALTESEHAVYDAARRQHSGVAVASLDGHRCSACHLDLSPGELDELKSTPVGEPGECPNCARFLVR
ncbi:MAG: zinc ribbon domain-containing protein [Ilumatobacteraceae bacterium]